MAWDPPVHDDVLFACVLANGSGVDVRLLATAILNRGTTTECLGLVGTADWRVPLRWIRRDVLGAIDELIAYHEMCLRKRHNSPHQAVALRAWRAFAVSDRCARLDVHQQKRRVLALQEARDVAATELREYEVRYPAAAAAVAGAEGRIAVRMVPAPPPYEEPEANVADAGEPALKRPCEGDAAAAADG